MYQFIFSFDYRRRTTQSEWLASDMWLAICIKVSESLPAKTLLYFEVILPEEKTVVCQAKTVRCEKTKLFSNNTLSRSRSCWAERRVTPAPRNQCFMANKEDRDDKQEERGGVWEGGRHLKLWYVFYICSQNKKKGLTCGSSWITVTCYIHNIYYKIISLHSFSSFKKIPSHSWNKCIILCSVVITFVSLFTNLCYLFLKINNSFICFINFVQMICFINYALYFFYKLMPFICFLKLFCFSVDL